MSRSGCSVIHGVNPNFKKCFKVKESMHFIKQKCKLNKKEIESTMENSTHAFVEMNLDEFAVING